MILSYTKVDGQTAEITLTEKPITIGRSPKADVAIEDDKASRLHCGIRWLDNQHLLKDLASKNGTYVNEERVETHALQGGDLIRVGRTLFTVKEKSTQGTTTALHEVHEKMSGGKGYKTILKEIVGDSGPAHGGNV